MAAARDLFDNHGFHQSSMAELATAAKVSVGQIYRLFKGKEDIISAIVQADADERCLHMDALRNRLDAGELTIEQTFEQLLLHIVDEKDEALSFDIMAESFRNRPVGDTIAAMCVRFRRYIRDFACAANPDLSGEALDGAEEVVLACLFGLGHRSLSRPCLSATDTARLSARMIVAALRAIR
ncbi:Possible Transcriptional Regulator, TetR family [Sphingobium indicum BiD32]|uniref:Possible Transcriptional Regulator, TetR family n=1 Tax=Sphingobium indicum BiD32 TaxID=1301087 RepID=N1MPG9_9SPHN|nr:TetR/AcrR family transcriptional regulator [Sphingobium indicum]CCW19105.1 Possible Transcriptional Regulator, TetR family [Sphingobium indicum BiD32]